MSEQIIVVGLGYVGLPLAVALARHFPTCGFDIAQVRIAELREGHDRTNEIEPERLKASSLVYADTAASCPGGDVYIVTVPTPVDDRNVPDLRPVLSATRTVAGMIDPARKPIIVYESTVYPGVTEDLCGPELEKLTGLKAGIDFFLGYSPERINPGDREHTVDKITKVVAGQTPEITARLAKIYGAITSGGVFEAASIKVAEAAKVIENTQRDVNIALMNEIARIFAKTGISVWDVLEAAGTKWNFLPFRPGLVGGHCIGVDPFYLSHHAEQLGHDPALILAGRSTNDGMPAFVADELHARRGGKPGSVLVLGLTFKENIPDLRNSKVVDLIARLRALGHDVTVHDPHADPEEAMHEYGIALDAQALDRSYDLIVAAVAHRDYFELGTEALRGKLNPGGLIADLPDALKCRDGEAKPWLWTL
ncbi:nucleotide sugar dehydrogenase [Sphingomonas koreensis]|uniref:Nucleotide sugar dehydrogenase n=1 Tax=Sphingomonas koreensis TaxID=93064 RepID=A0A430G1W1_9SPHN|nr:nucleotide sugar dehydrogenase [Sphingomonas koreensis]RSU70612.1 nucleotide sugar dehydrogenase [Sphingomonas koreensis]RSY82041.1 nucleotide sugar dehydrogenase [Sphingomonas koreensis]